MITISNDFSASIGSTTREMKGYVEVTYSSSEAKKNANVIRYPEILQIGNSDIPVNGIIDDDRKGKNYASLEKDYFQLDGTFVLPNNVADKNPGMGYVSKKTFEDDIAIPLAPFIITTSFGNTSGVNGLTMYFVNNKPLELEITVQSNNNVETFTQEDCIINDNGAVQLIFTERTIDIINIYVKDVLYPKRRIRLQEVDFGLSAIYENEELISFKTIEEIDIYNDSIPGNDLEVVIGDYDNKFDFNNEKGITKYLNNNVLLKPYVGVLTLGSGIEYCTKGVYWLDSYNSDGKQATLKGKDIYSKLQDNDYDKYYYIENERKYSGKIPITPWLKFKSEKWGINIIDKHIPSEEIKDTSSALVNDMYSKVSTKLNSLQKAGIQVGGTFNADRYGNVIYKSLYGIVDNYNDSHKAITLDSIKEIPKINAKTPIKNYTVKEYVLNFNEIGTFETFYSNTFVSNGIIELYIDAGGYKTMKYPEVTNATILDSTWSVDPTKPDGEKGFYGTVEESFAYVKLQCNGNVTITIQGYDVKRSEGSNIRSVNNFGNDIEIANDFLSDNTSGNIRKYTDLIINFNLNKRKKRMMSLEYNGDPSLECGDILGVVNWYDDTKIYQILLTKIQSEFKGSYSESIEGEIVE